VVRTAGLLIGAGLLAVAVVALMSGAAEAAPMPAILGVVVLVGVAFERWRYKPLIASAGPGFHPTEERFIDPESGRAVQVYVHAETGERRYVQTD
jgi:hypothetical protein